MKICAKCKEQKELINFTFSRNRYESYCKLCKALSVKQKYNGEIREKSLVRKQKMREDLSDNYIIEKLKKENVPIEKIPELIELKRSIILIKRQINVSKK